MSENIYTTPESELLVDDGGVTAEFYVVSLRKFNILFFCTFGVYSIFWFYKNWRIIKTKQNREIWPVPRAIFSIFFAHSLFREIEGELEEKTGEVWNRLFTGHNVCGF